MKNEYKVFVDVDHEYTIQVNIKSEKVVRTSNNNLTADDIEIEFDGQIEMICLKDEVLFEI